MLEKLIESIEQVKSRMKEHEDYLAGLEWRTRIVLIDPLLKALGWDTANPRLVKLEHSIKGSIFDYAFCDENGEILLIVEAKKLNDPFKSLEAQLGKYLLTTGVPYILLTNGNKWILYNMGKLGILEDKVEFEINLQTDSTSSAALSFLSIWRNAFPDAHSSQPLSKANRPIFRKFNPPDKTDPDSGPALVSQTEWFTLKDCIQKDRPWPPAKIRFPDGKSEQVSKLTYTDCLKQSIRYLLSVGKISTSDLPISLPHHVGGKLPKHVAICLEIPSEDILTQYSKFEWNGQTIYFYSNFSGPAIAKKIEVLSDKYGVDQIQFSS